MAIEDGNGDELDPGTNGHHGNGKPYRVLMDDDELAARFQRLAQAAREKGYSEEEIGFGLISATTEHLLDAGEPDCCVMQLLLDFIHSYYEYWHSRMGAEDEPDEDGEDA